MKELFYMWRHTKMVVLVAMTAAVYAAILIPLKSIPLIPGITEIRPANLIPLVFGLLFGPAGAWGSAIGNLIGDFFGTLGIGSLFGFLGNFFYGMAGYKIMNYRGFLSLPRKREELSPLLFVKFSFISLISSAICAEIIAWGLNLLGLFPFSAVAIIIFINNFFISAILGPFLAYILYPRVEKWDLLYQDIMEPEEISKGPFPTLGLILMIVGSVGGLALGLFLSFSYGREHLNYLLLPLQKVFGHYSDPVFIFFFLILYVFGLLLI